MSKNKGDIVTKFVINKNIDNEFMFQIKQNGSIEAMVIEPTDTFVFKLKDPKTGDVRFTVNAAVVDDINGRIKVVIPQSTADGLTREVGDRADNFYNKPVYSAVIIADTANNGKFVAKLAKVYVE